MQIGLNRTRHLYYGLISSAAAIVGLIVIIFLAAARIGGGLQGAVIGATTVLAVYGFFYLRGYFVNPGSVVAITGDGITFNVPGVGKIRWDQIDKTEIRRVGGSSQLCVYVRDPAPRPKMLGGLMYGVNRRRTGDTTRIAIPTGRLDATPEEIDEALQEYRKS